MFSKFLHVCDSYIYGKQQKNVKQNPRLLPGIATLNLQVTKYGKSGIFFLIFSMLTLFDPKGIPKYKMSTQMCLVGCFKYNPT